jgi:hypothetical protein
MPEIPASKELVELVFAALDHAIASVESGGPLIPFVMAHSGSEKKLTRFMAATLDDAVAQARHFTRIQPPTVTRVALAVDGFINNAEGIKQDAILVEAHERGAAKAVFFCQRYVPASSGTKAATIGNAAYLGEKDPLMRTGGHAAL